MAKKYDLTEAGLENLQNQLEGLKAEQKKNLVAIKDAREQGDLSENADYSSAREKQESIKNQISEIENIIRNAVIIDVNGDTNLGKIIKVHFLNIEDDDDDEDDEIAEYYLVGTIEADPMIGKISNESPLGKAILSSKVGDIVLVRTDLGSQFEVEILEISKPKSDSKTKRSKKN